jgi:4-hydroxyphenylpyruvate dioxygenase
LKISIATVSLSGDLVEKLEAIASAGLSGVEIFDNDLLSFSGSAADVRCIAADLELEIVAFQPFRDFESLPTDKRDRGFGRAVTCASSETCGVRGLRVGWGGAAQSRLAADEHRIF